MNQSLILFLVWFVIPMCTNGLISIYNLTNDPYESTSLYDNDDTEIQEIQTLIENRLNQVQNEILNITTISQSEFDNSIFKKAGGFVPWLDYDDNDDLDDDQDDGTMDRKEAYENAPNIIFMLLDDVGINDFSFNGTDNWLFSTTPNLNQLRKKGITLRHHYTAWVCGPSRASFLTGRYPYQLGYSEMPEVDAILPLNESTIAQEFQALGYRTALVGKWHVGFERNEYTPTYRGFDRFYGYYGGSIGYYSKMGSAGHFDLQDQLAVVTEPGEVSNKTHLTTLLQSKVDAIIANHSMTHFHDKTNVPLFLYYSLQNVHVGGVEELEAPQSYLDTCKYMSSTEEFNVTLYGQNLAYCALVIMFDEAIGNTTCAIQAHGMENNTIVIITSDNGGVASYPGVNYPYRGAKGSVMQGGIHNLAFVRAPTSLVPLHRHGGVFDGLVHISDWFPTLLKLASNDTWIEPLNRYSIDGIDIFAAIRDNTPSPRTEIIHNYDHGRDKGAIQFGYIKYVIGPKAKVVEPVSKFEYVNPVTVSTCKFDLDSPSPLPSGSPTALPSYLPTLTTDPTSYPTSAPTATFQPSPFPSLSPLPTRLPSSVPTQSMQPTSAPTTTYQPTLMPTSSPLPTLLPTMNPLSTLNPSHGLSSSNTVSPTISRIRKKTNFQLFGITINDRNTNGLSVEVLIGLGVLIFVCCNFLCLCLFKSISDGFDSSRYSKK